MAVAGPDDSVVALDDDFDDNYGFWMVAKHSDDEGTMIARQTSSFPCLSSLGFLAFRCLGWEGNKR